MNEDNNFIHKYCDPFLLPKNHENISSGSEYDSEKRIVRHKKNMIWGLLLNKSKGFEWWVSLLFFVLNGKKLSSHMAQISEHTNSPIQKNILMIK